MTLLQCRRRGRARVLLSVGIAVSVVACSSTARPATAWPGAYRTMVCAALGYLAEAHDQISEVSDASEALDLVGVVEAARDMEARAQDAQEAVELAPRWAPGDTLAGHVAAAALSYRRAANLIATGAEETVASLIVDGVREAQAGAEALQDAAEAADILRGQHGWERC